MIITPSIREICYPFMLTLTAMKDLDIVFDKIINIILDKKFEEISMKVRDKLKNRIEDDDQDFVKSQIKQQLDEKSSLYSKKVSLIFNNNISIIDNNLCNAVSNLSMINNNPKGIIYIISYEDIAIFRLKIECLYGKSVKYEFNGFDEGLKSLIFQEIESWIDRYDPNFGVQVWSMYRMQLSVSLLLIGFILLLIPPSTRESYSDLVKKEIISVIDSNDIKQDEINFIVVSMAKLLSGYQPKSFKIKNHFLTYLSLFFLVTSLITLYPPKTTISYGKSKKWIVFWHVWTRVVIFFIPSTIVFPVLINYLSKYI